jgi:hypothetical protein
MDFVTWIQKVWFCQNTNKFWTFSFIPPTRPTPHHFESENLPKSGHGGNKRKDPKFFLSKNFFSSTCPQSIAVLSYFRLHCAIRTHSSLSQLSRSIFILKCGPKLCDMFLIEQENKFCGTFGLEPTNAIQTSDVFVFPWRQKRTWFVHNEFSNKNLSLRQSKGLSNSTSPSIRLYCTLPCPIRSNFHRSLSTRNYSALFLFCSMDQNYATHFLIERENNVCGISGKS